jgi:hypothetical protein
MKLLQMQLSEVNQNKWRSPKGVIFAVIFLTCCSLANAQRWTPVTPFPGHGAGTALLRPDGIVMVQEVNGPGGSATGNWYTLTPDNTGGYTTGTWALYTSTAGLGYGPLYFGSAVIDDGQIIFEGGNYNFGVKENTTMGFDYRPIVNTWNPTSMPSVPRLPNPPGTRIPS